MLRLDLKVEPRWVEVHPGVRLQVAPVTTALMAEARQALDAGALEDAAPEVQAVAMGKAVARLAILAWEGVGDAEGKPLPVTDEAVDALLDLFPVFEGFQREVLGPALLLEQEKNASPPLPTGSSAGARATARPAKRSARPARNA